MATQEDVRRIALRLPDTAEAENRFAFSVKNGGKRKEFAWIWLERAEPKGPRVPNPEVIAVRVSDSTEKEMLVASEPAKYFTEPHYAGFPAVLVRLAAVEPDELEELLIDAWRIQAPRSLVKRYDAEAGEDQGR